MRLETFRMSLIGLIILALIGEFSYLYTRKEKDNDLENRNLQLQILEIQRENESIINNAESRENLIFMIKEGSYIGGSDISTLKNVFKERIVLEGDSTTTEGSVYLVVSTKLENNKYKIRLKEGV